MTVYIEYVLIDNFVIDYLLLKATFAITGSNYSKRWLFLCAFFGAIFALLFPLIKVGGILLALVKIAFGLLLVAISVKHKSAKEFYINLVVFFALTFAVGGAVIGLFSLFNIPYSTELSVAIMVIPVYIVTRGITAVVRFVYRRKSVMAGVFETEISLSGKVKKGKGFYDTGNGIYYKDNPVIFCDKKFAKGLIDGALIRPLKKITVNTATGQDELFAFQTESVKIYIDNKEHIFNNVTLCITKKSVGVGYDIILHPDLIKEQGDEQTGDSIKKVS